MDRARRFVMRGGWPSGVTVVEAVLAMAIGIMAVSGMIGVYLSIGKMSKAGDLSYALQEASLTVAIIQQDLTQAVPEPVDPASRDTGPVPIVRALAGGSVQLFRADLQKDGTVRRSRVVYSKQETAGRHIRLLRELDGRSGSLRGLFKSVRFEQLEGAGGPFVRVSLTVSAHDTDDRGRPEPEAQETVVSSLVRVAGPELMGSSFLLGGGIRKGAPGGP
jgi:hypothetical protein